LLVSEKGGASMASPVTEAAASDGGKVAEDAVWSYPEPLADAPPLAGYMAFYWDKMDEWLEEDEPAIVHARDPYHRVDVLDTSRHVKVTVNGELVAESRRTRVLFETGLPPRWWSPLGRRRFPPVLRSRCSRAARCAHSHCRRIAGCCSRSTHPTTGSRCFGSPAIG